LLAPSHIIDFINNLIFGLGFSVAEDIAKPNQQLDYTLATKSKNVLVLCLREINNSGIKLGLCIFPIAKSKTLVCLFIGQYSNFVPGRNMAMSPV